MMKKYSIIFTLLFIVEVAIAYFHFNPFIRGFLGDVFVVLLLYCFFKIFIKNNCFKIAVSVLAFAFLVEIVQFFRLSEIRNIQSKVLLIVMGSVFDPLDLVAYFIGFLILVVSNKLLKKDKSFFM